MWRLQIMFGKEFENMLIAIECFAIVGFIGVLGGIGYGIYRLITWLIQYKHIKLQFYNNVLYIKYDDSEVVEKQ